ncbi:MAG: Hsp20/alpha crystallin family protein [Chthonomonadales bacterium]|nr:Hsp20/alpha crystallin family protein [Chthonomonadales bacterium]
MAEKTVANPIAEEETQVEAAVPTRETTREGERFLPPPVDIYETADGLVVLADLPGVTADRLTVNVKDGILTIEGRSECTMEGTPVYQEFELPHFFRQFELADSVDSGAISASLRHGVLSLTLPKAEAAKPRSIKVDVG